MAKILSRFKHLFPWFTRTPVVLQMELMECGAAALTSVMGFYGKFVSLEDVRIQSDVTRDGSNIQNLIKAAEHYGFEAKRHQINIEEIADITLPAIISWSANHFVVLEKIRKKHAYINDPNTGNRRINIDELKKRYTGSLIEIKKGKNFKADGSPPSVLKGLLRRSQGNTNAIIYLFIIGLILVIPGLLIPMFTKVYVDNYLIYQMDSWLKPILIGMIITAIARGIIRWVEGYVILNLKLKISSSASSKFLWHVIRLPMNFFLQRDIGDITTRISLNDHVADLITNKFASSILNIFMAIFYFILMFYYNLTLTVCVLAMALINIFSIEFTASIRKNLSMQTISEQSKFSGGTINGLTLIETLKSSSRENEFFSRWSGYMANFFHVSQRIEVLTIITQIFSLIINSFTTIIILGVGSFLILQGEMTIGMLVAFQSLSASFFKPIDSLISTTAEIQELHGEMMELDDVHNHKIDDLFLRKDRIKNREFLDKLSGKIEFKDVTFGYNVLEKPLIENFNLTIYPGQRVAIVGRSGCGKSTISRLMMQLYKPWSGEILFDGVPAQEIPRQIFVNSVAMVAQEIFIFEGTAQENVTMWNPFLQDDEVINALKDSLMYKELNEREHGIYCHVAESGHNLSGGQRQRIEISRALAINPRILILDEATSALDPLTEMSIDNNIRRRGCSTLIIAHRLSTIRDADLILMMSDGKIIEQGTHDSLLKNQGCYADLLKVL